MTTFLSRIPFDSSLFVKLPKLNDYWSTSESSDSSDSQYQDTSDQSSQSDSSVSQSPQSASPAPEAQVSEEDFDFQQPSTSSPQASDVEADQATGDKAGIADLIAEYGSSAATSWLEFARYKIWRPTVPIPHSSFPPVQGYLRSDPYVFAWGNPVVSDPAALEATCAAFIDWAKSQNLRAIWLCVDDQMEKVLGGQGSKFAWSVLSCIVEDYLDPRSVVELAHSSGGGSEVKDFKKNLRRAQRANVRVREVQPDQWTDSMKRQVEQGIVDWKKNKTGIQIASVSHFFTPAFFLSLNTFFRCLRLPLCPGSTLSTVAIGSPKRIPTLLPSSSSLASATRNIKLRTQCLSPMLPVVLRRRSSTVSC
jgi:hypothetical protein